MAKATGNGGSGNLYWIISPDKSCKMSADIESLPIEEHIHNSTKYELTVNIGNGDGEYANGATITISADKDPEGKVFDKWTGDTQYLSDVNSATTTVTMPDKDITVSATYKDKEPVVKKDNYLVVSTWEAGQDELGSAVSIDSSNKSDTLLTAAISLGNSNSANEEYAWAKISGYANGLFDNVTSAEIIYSANKPVKVVLDQEVLSEKGESYFYELPAGDERVEKIDISSFAQPSWATATALDLTKVTSLSFEATKEGETTELELLGIQLNGFELVTPVIEQFSVKKNENIFLTSLTSESCYVSQKGSGESTLALFNLSGKQLYTVTRDFSKSGLVFFGNKLPSGMYMVRITGFQNSVSCKKVVK